MAARHDDRAGGGEHTPDAAADRDLGAGDLSGGGTAHLAHAPPAIHPGMHVREAAAIRYGLKNLGFAPRGEAGRLITNGMSRSAMGTAQRRPNCRARIGAVLHWKRYEPARPR